MKTRIRVDAFDPTSNSWDSHDFYPEADGKATYWNIAKFLKPMPRPYTMFAAFKGQDVHVCGNLPNHKVTVR